MHKGARSRRRDPLTSSADRPPSPVDATDSADWITMITSVERQIGQRTSLGVDPTRQVVAEIRAVAMPTNYQPGICLRGLADDKMVAVRVPLMLSVRPDGLKAYQVRCSKSTAGSLKSSHRNVL